MLVRDEGRRPYPSAAFAAHLGETFHLAGRNEQRHAMTADAAQGDGPFGSHIGAIVGAAAAIVGRTLRQGFAVQTLDGYVLASGQSIGAEAVGEHFP